MEEKKDIDPIIQALSRPFDARDVEWLIKVNPKEGDKWAMVIPYVNSQSVIRRFNEVCGFRWSLKFLPVTVAMQGTIAVICEIAIEGATRCDVGDAQLSATEPMKAAHSDAIKRAARLYGVGEQLRDYPRVRATCEAYGKSWVIKDDTKAELDHLVELVTLGQPLPKWAHLQVFDYKPSQPAPAGKKVAAVTVVETSKKPPAKPAKETAVTGEVNDIEKWRDDTYRYCHKLMGYMASVTEQDLATLENVIADLQGFSAEQLKEYGATLLHNTRTALEAELVNYQEILKELGGKTHERYDPATGKFNWDLFTIAPDKLLLRINEAKKEAERLSADESGEEDYAIPGFAK